MLSRSIDEACHSVGCSLAAFVYVPAHVHLLVWGIHAKEDVSTLLAKIKQPVSIQVRMNLEAARSRLLPRLMVRERPGKIVFRFWQEGPGFDRNLFTTKAVQHSIDYIHMNPVKRRGKPSLSTEPHYSSHATYAALATGTHRSG
jgi:putative transposase